MADRNGFAAGGHWIVDHVKVVDVWPEQDTIAIILDEKRGTGGCPYNLLMDWSKMDRNLHSMLSACWVMTQMDIIFWRIAAPRESIART